MTFNNQKFTSYCASSEIIEADDFKTLFNATQRCVRDYAMAAIIVRNSDNKVIAFMLDCFGQYKVFRPNEIHPNLRNFIKAHFVMENNEWMWKKAGLE